MSVAKDYFQKQFAKEEFRRPYLEEKVKMDIEYQLEELKKDIQTNKPVEELIKKVDLIEEYVISV